METMHIVLLIVTTLKYSEQTGELSLFLL